jgi:hypothetical protein
MKDNANRKKRFLAPDTGAAMVRQAVGDAT